MRQLPYLRARKIRKHNWPRERPGVILLNGKQWSYIKRRYDISPREIEVARLACQGFTNKEIANDLNIEQATVKTHLRNIYRRLHVKNKITLLLRFVEGASQL